MLQTGRRLLEMIRFSHTLFALPFALLSAALAWHSKGAFAWIELLGILLGMVLARSAAMAFNRLADRNLDAANPRTAMRHLPSGQLSVAAVWLFTLLCGAGFIASTALFLLAQPANPWPLYLSVPVLLFICAYSYTKRFTALAHVWLGASLCLAPLAAWIAIRGLSDLLPPTILGLAVLFWVTGFDIIYASQDADFDRKARLHSIPAALGTQRSLRVALFCHMLTIALLVGLYFVAAPPLGMIYLIGVASVAILLVYEHYLVSPQDLTRVNQAFFQVNAVISVGLFLLVLVEIARVRWFE
ncbi:MAG: UbiA family prenyltransferase [Planctomycetes bacterium]|nr:UbiA family prenyltransferase [Planctomycetota bacterium]